MRTILDACQPREEILAGTFNPEMFKASLSRVLDDYTKGQAMEGAPSIYSDPVAFFRDATYPTRGFIDILGNALGRLALGDLSRPAMQRLDTAFGGGKTHTLIGLAHATLQGREVAEHTQDILDPEVLPVPGAIRVVAVIGDTVDTIREELGPNGRPLPNTLWWLMAQEILSEGERRPIQARLNEISAPASDEFFDVLFGDRPTLVIIDEVAQYLSRMEAAFPGTGAEQSAAFLMSLATYAEDRSDMAVVLSLASTANAFGEFNQLLRQLQQQHDMSEAEAEGVIEDAQRGMRDVLNRSSEATTPIQEGDLSRVMAKRLFRTVNTEAAAETADAFVSMYRRAGTDLPAGAHDPELRDRLIGHYPFHPSLIEFLAEDLAQVESFQGTRGVLRALARGVRRIWEHRLPIPLIQTGHLDLGDGHIRTELLGKTGNDDLRTVLDADISKSAESAVTARTVAGELDVENPHPEGFPVAEWSWRVVFLHSLVGRAGGLEDEKFGTDMAQAVFEMASPDVPPASVRSMLERIPTEANYLREREGRLYADTAPTLNNILRRIQDGVSEEQALDRVDQAVRGLIRSDLFEIHANITHSEDLPESERKPQLGLLSFRNQAFDPTAFVEQRGDSPRVNQNMVFLLAPSTAHPQGPAGEVWSEQRNQQEVRTRQRLLLLARKAIAVEKLRQDPQSWGVQPDHLKRQEFRDTRDKIPHEMQTAVEESYRYLVFPSQEGGRVVIRDLGKGGGGPTAGGSGGLMLEDAIRQQLTKEGELVTAEHAGTKEVLIALSKRFFANRPQVTVTQLRENFSRRREWPILQRPDLLGDILREGANQGVWCLGYMPERDAHKPEALYHQEHPPPIDANPAGEGWLIATRAHAKQLGWLESIVRDPNAVARWIEGELGSMEQAAPDALKGAIEEQHDTVDPQVYQDQVTHLLAASKLVAYPEAAFDAGGAPDPEQAVTGRDVPPGGVSEDEFRLVPYHLAQERGWVIAPGVQVKDFQLSEPGQIQQILNLLSGTALSGSQTEVRRLSVSGATSGGGQFQMALLGSTVGQLIANRELFAALANRIQFDGPKARLDISLGHTENGCRFLQALEAFKE